MFSKNRKMVIALIILCIIGVIIGTHLVSTNKNDDDYPAYVQTIEVNDEFFKGMSVKENILYKMFNSIDFYNTISGKYKTISNYEGNDLNNDNMEIEFYVDTRNKNTYTKQKGKGFNKEVTSNSDKVIIIDNDEKTYHENKITTEKDDIIHKLKVKDRFDKNGMFIKRKDTSFLNLLNDILCEQEVAYIQLSKMDSWDIVEEKLYLKRPSIYISGKFLNESKTEETDYNIIIDKETGIILKYNTFNKEGKVIRAIEVTEIEINKSIPQERFNVNLKNYTKN